MEYYKKNIVPGDTAKLCHSYSYKSMTRDTVVAYSGFSRALKIASVVNWSQLLATNPEVPGSILGTRRFSENY
jgi:hypothetical protein